MHHSNLPKGLNWEKLARYFAGECSDQESGEITSLLSAHTEIREYLSTLRQMRDRARANGKQWNLETEWVKLSQRTAISEQPTISKQLSITAIESHSTVYRILRIAAAVVILIGASYLFVNFKGIFLPSSQQLAMQEVTTERGQRIKLELTEGTKVSLNASSSLRFPEKYFRGTREVYLSGEAYFDVTHRENLPFIVHAGDARVQVLGTGFNVKAWPDENKVEVVLAQGRVALTSEKQPGEVILEPAQRAVLAQGESPTTPEFVDLDKHLAWLDGKLIFEKTPFREVVKQLQRTYDITCQIEDSTLLPHRLTATFTKEQSLNEIFKSLSIALNMGFKQSGNVVKFFSDETTTRRRDIK